MKTVTNVMANAWKIAGFAQAKFGGKVREYFAESLKLAWSFEKKENPQKYAAKTTEIVPRETMPNKAPIAPIVPIAPKAKKALKLTKKRTKKVTQDEGVKIEYTGLPDEIIKLFPKYTNTLNYLIETYVSYANKNIGHHMDRKRFNFIEGMEVLSKVTDFQGLQATMVAYFLEDISKYIIRKFLEFGAGYKKKNYGMTPEIAAEQNSYQKASSNRGNITAFDVDDIYNSLVVDAYRLTFDENMFYWNQMEDEKPFMVNTTLFFRISNILRTELRRLKSQTKVSIDKAMMHIEDKASRSTEAEALTLAQEMGIFTDAEMKIIQLRVNGYQKNEIDKKVGKRTDRDFARMEKKYQSAI